jgi:broad specificity phosphatase PhoE
MPTLLLIRHGENDYLKNNKMPGRLAGIHLNTIGIRQAEELAKTLKILPIKAIYSSPLERAIETATPLALSLGMGIQIRTDLTDTDVGEWEGRSWKSLSRTRLWQVVQTSPSQFQFPAGETFIQIQERVVKSLDAIVDAHPEGIVVVVFHADPIKLAIAHYIGLSLDHFQCLTAHTGSVTILKMGAIAPKIIAMNLIPPFSLPNM